LSNSDKNQEPLYAKHLSRLTRPFVNFDFPFIRRVRERAVDCLRLGLGGQVLDLGCGGGGSFPYLERAVGPHGQIVGVDVSSQSCLNARRRAQSHGWNNIRVIEDSAERVVLSGRYDGALMFAAPDVYTSESALIHVLSLLKSDARVSIFGAKFSGRQFGKLLDSFFRFMFRALSPATPLPDEAPWRLLARRLKDLSVEEYFYGSMFLACGTLKGVEELGPLPETE